MGYVALTDIAGRSFVVEEHSLWEQLSSQKLHVCGLDVSTVLALRYEYVTRRGPLPATPATVREVFASADHAELWVARSTSTSCLQVKEVFASADHAEAVSDLLAERARQDAKWGGPSHDDQLTPLDWHETLADYNGWTRRMAVMGSQDKAYRRAIQTAALALAQAESISRKLRR